MFSRNFMVNLLFANPGDTYYTDGLLQFKDLNEYIWYDIRKNGIFDSVFFLQNEKNFFKVSEMGDCTRDMFTPGIFGWHKSSFRNWMLDRLKDKKRKCAIVCPLSDFCNLLSLKDWAPLLEALQELSAEGGYSGVLILTGPPYVESVRPYLLEGPVFARRDARKGSVSLCPPIAKMREDPVGDRSYDSLKDTMGDACVFLNEFGNRAVEAIVNQAVIRNGHKVTVDHLLVEDYLKQTLNSRKRGYEPLMELFPGVSIDLGFKDLYRMLSNPETWKQVEKLAVEQPVYEEFDSRRVPMFYRNHVIKRGLALEVPTKGLCEDGKKEFVRFKQELLTTKNRPLNKTVLEKMESLCENYNLHKRNECCEQQVLRLLLTVLRFCASYLYADVGSKAESTVLKITECMKSYLKIWSVCAKLARDIEATNFATTSANAAKLQYISRKQLEQSYSSYKEKLQLLEQGIYTLSTSAQIEEYDFGVMEDVLRESSELEAYDMQSQPQPQPSDDELEPEPEPKPQEEFYDIIPSDYIDCPV